MSFLAYMLIKHLRKQREKRNREPNVLDTFSSEESDINLQPVILRNHEENEGLTAQLFDYGLISKATGDFNDENKLGEGGFGLVYKGILPDGHEIAIKRLSKRSGQGLREFKNEVELVSKLQHRNLVSLLGCCIHGEERILVYEFLPNRSLDAFLFDAERNKILDWSSRYSIIEGIARGMLYLHRDSRLKIMHRDLKASNVLLDENFSPKISDFGTARIFHGDQVLAKTNIIVGTIGYMSPEYAMEGRISEKSDVFSFGVLILEIVSGKRNNYFIDEEQALSLLGFAWKLWTEDRALELIDPSLGTSLPQSEVLKCIKVGLLCTQELAIDRPTMSSVVFMLGSDIDIPTPNQVAYFTGRSSTNSTVTHGYQTSSEVDLSFSKSDDNYEVV